MKKIKKYIFIVMLIFFSINLFGEQLKNSSNLINGTLPNGINYYIYKNKKPEGKAELNLIVKVGSLMEEDREQGIAHFMEHMAFNGTTKYEKNDMVKYLQSIGLDFGGDLNAYTSFDRTVYKLQVPTDDSVAFEKGVEVLREWATEATLDSEQVESEKKVVIEEWRLRQGLSQRLGDIHKKAIFGGSRYFDRFPIGLPETINGANPDIVRGFYEKWYVPENISIVAVGDFDSAQVEELIKKYFSYEDKRKAPSVEDYRLKDLKDSYIVFSDPEITYNTFYMTKLLKRDIVNSTENFKKSVVDQLLFNILNTRLSNLAQEENSPLVESLVYYYPINKYSNVFSGVTVIREGRVEEGTALLNNFFKSSAKEGINNGEFELEKKNLYNNYKTFVANKDSIQNETYIDAVVNYVLDGEIFLDVDREFEIFSEVLDSIKLSDLNERITEIYDDETLYFLTAPTGKNLITEDRLKEIIEADKKDSSNTLIFSANEKELPPIKLNKGSIVSTEGENFVLSNGIKVFSKSTDFDKDKIYIKFFKKEGSSPNTYEGYINSLFASDLVIGSGVGELTPKDLEAFMKGKNFSITPYINDYEQGITIASDKENLIPALEYMSYTILEPKIDDGFFKTAIANIKEGILNRENSPRAVYGDEIARIYSGGNRRREPLSMEDIEKISKERALNIFKEKFDSFKDYNLVVVGSFDKKELPELLEKYFASLPAGNNDKRAMPLGLNIPKNIIKKDVVKGIDKKATVTLIFPYDSVYGEKERILYNGFSRVLNIALIENIREKIGGVYSISSRTSLSQNNYGENSLTIRFSCDTERVEEIKTAVLNTISVLLKDIDQTKIDSVVKNYELSYKSELKENPFWINYLYQKAATDGKYQVPTPEEYRDLMTKENLLEYSKKALNLNNYIDVTLIPEKDSL